MKPEDVRIEQLDSIRNVIKKYHLKYDGDLAHCGYCIAYTGKGFYSLYDTGIYFKGIFPTYSRIKLY